MIDGLISGRIFGSPVEKTGSNGQPFGIAKLRAQTTAGENIIVNVIVFEAHLVEQLLELDDADSVSFSGSFTPKVWTDHQGNSKPALDMIAHAMLTIPDKLRD